jgi:hypothetical protein
VDTEKYLDEADELHAPLLMHLTEEDEFISKRAQAEIKAALADKPDATVYSYPGQPHASRSPVELPKAMTGRTPISRWKPSGLPTKLSFKSCFESVVRITPPPCPGGRLKPALHGSRHGMSGVSA